MNSAFQTVYEFLLWLSLRTGLTYDEVNIIVYYFLLPLAFFVLLDRVFRTWRCTISFLCLSGIALLLIPNFALFSDSLFDLSVAFLQQFSWIGWNYTEASVWICIIFPGIVFLLLCCAALLRRAGDRQRRSYSDEI